MRRRTRRQLDRIELALQCLLRKEAIIMLDESRILADVETATTVDASIVALVTSIAAELRAAGQSDPALQAALDAAATQLENANQAIVDAVAANTVPVPTPIAVPELATVPPDSVSPEANAARQADHLGAPEAEATVSATQGFGQITPRLPNENYHDYVARATAAGYTEVMEQNEWEALPVPAAEG